MSYYLGIDTSNYTTSLALADHFGTILADERLVLNVKQGMRGLRQSEALFQHVENLPVLFERLCIDCSQIECVGVSIKPRRLDESYMPVFRAGAGFAQAIAKSLGVPLRTFSHQEGHIKAGLYSVSDFADSFYVVHISGGTTEILDVCKQPFGYQTQIVGKTLDISVGQLIDRIGVAAGLPFPSGKTMDDMAKQGALTLPHCVNFGDMNFSGAEVQGCRLAKKQEQLPELFYAVFLCVAVSLEKALINIIKKYGTKQILMVGGVAANSIIKKSLCDTFKSQIQFASPQLSTDNAVGIALLAKEVHRGQHFNGDSLTTQ